MHLINSKWKHYVRTIVSPKYSPPSSLFNPPCMGTVLVWTILRVIVLGRISPGVGIKRVGHCQCPMPGWNVYKRIKEGRMCLGLWAEIFIKLAGSLPHGLIAWQSKSLCSQSHFPLRNIYTSYFLKTFWGF